MQGNLVSLYVAVRFAKLLATPFTEWKAYTLGLIDETGKKIKEATSRSERAQFTSWMNIVRNMKRLLQTFPGGKSKFASYAAALGLLKEETGKASGERPDPEVHRILHEAILQCASNADRKLLKLVEEASFLKKESVLEPGNYMIVDGVEFAVRTEMGAPLRFTLDKPNKEIEKIFGEGVHCVIDRDGKRTFVCAIHVLRVSD